MITYQGGPDGVVATGRVDVPLLRHPTEPQRFALAVISVVSGIGVAIALTVVVGWVQVLILV